MKIAIKNGEDGQWKQISTGGQQGDDHIKDLVRQIPGLIPIEELAPGEPNLKVCVDSSSISGSEDGGGIIGVDDNGRITIVECKFADSSSIRREIMGRAMEYAMSLWEMSYEEFDGMVLNSEGKSLVELMREKISEVEWSEEKFKNAVASSLQQGKFRLIMTLQRMTNELKRTIEFLNARGPFSSETYAVEMQHFSDGETEVVIPRITSFVETEQRTSTERPVLERSEGIVSSQAPSSEEPTVAGSEQSAKAYNPTGPTLAQPEQAAGKGGEKNALFFAKCEDNVGRNTIKMIEKLYDFSTEVADDIIWWGAGGASAFNFVLAELTVFVVDADGKIMFNFSEWQRESDSRDLLPQFIEKLKGVGILRKQKEDYTRWPDFKVEEFFADSNDFTTFEESIKFLKQSLTD